MSAAIIWHFPALARFYMLGVEAATMIDVAANTVTVIRIYRSG